MNLETIAFFEGIDPVVIEAVSLAAKEKSFQNGQTVFKKGDPANFLYILKSGQIDLILKQEDNTILSLTEPGEIFGWSSIVEKGVYTSSSICKSDTAALEISKHDIERIFNEHSKAAVKFYQRLGSIFSRRLTKATE